MSRDIGAFISLDRLKRDIEALAKIGGGPEGVTRRSYTPADRQAREFVAGLMRDAGLDVRIDPVGNVFGRRAGMSEKPVIMFGSHIDSVPAGGMFDGCLGVLGAIEVMRALNQMGIRTQAPLEAVCFADEEGAWGGGTFGSRAFIGAVSESEIQAVLPDGETLAHKMESVGLRPLNYREAAKPYPVGAYLELHIEQGGVLDYEGINIGVVTGIVGITRGTVTVNGVANHAGTTPMHMRDDALVKASRFILFVHEEARRNNDMVATIGRVNVSPGAINVIPGKVVLSLEMRSMSDKRVQEALVRIRSYAAAAGGIDVECGLAKPAVLMDARIMDAIVAACKNAGVSFKRMHSGAGHDAMCIATIAPTGMIFVPSKGGISHSKDEWTDWDKARIGVEVLARSVLMIDGL